MGMSYHDLVDAGFAAKTILQSCTDFPQSSYHAISNLLHVQTLEKNCRLGGWCIYCWNVLNVSNLLLILAPHHWWELFYSPQEAWPFTYPSFFAVGIEPLPGVHICISYPTDWYFVAWISVFGYESIILLLGLRAGISYFKESRSLPLMFEGIHYILSCCVIVSCTLPWVISNLEK